MTISPSSNTKEFLNNLNEEQRNKIAGYKFEPSEWRYEAVGAEKEFNKISNDLYLELSKNAFDNEYESIKTFSEYQKQVYSACFEVLKKLKAEGFFKRIVGKDIFLIFTVSDYDLEKSKVKEIVSTLNNEYYTKEYLKWMTTWGE